MQKRLGKYELLKEIGKGGMGNVYLARDSESNATVALKVLPPEFTRTPKYIERFRREAKAVARLNHPNIIKIFDIGEQESTHYFAMEYLGGMTLRKLLEQRGRLPVAEAISILVQIADALDTAHAQGIIHRDVKPDNIMSDESGKFKIMDFGIAHTEQGTRLTVTGTIMGTPEYMSPEQASGTAVDKRTDIYALGIVLYEMLTGKVPFNAQTAVEILQMHITKMPESPKLINPEIPGNLSNIIAKMIEKQPANRYESFRHVINALTQALPEHLRAAGGVTAKEIAAAAPPPAQARPAPRVRERVILQTPTTVRVALAASILLNVLLFGVLLLGRGGAPEATEPPQPMFTLGGQVFAPPAVFGKNLIVAAEDGTVRAVDVETGSVQWKFETKDKVTAAPLVDGDRVFVGSWDQHVYSLSAGDGSLFWKVPVGGCVFSSPALADGILYVCTREGNVFAIDAESGALKWKGAGGNKTSFSPAVHEEALFIASDENRLFAFRCADGTRLGELETGRIKMPVLVQDSKLYYAAFNDLAERDELAALVLSPGLSSAGIPVGRHKWTSPIEPAATGQ
ncbi:MAG: hypothetical protein C4520_19825 [Candidatus Abyssobacteria bacterium SURF_5]|uniref:non-specific serine/threonine protein kinase n=1 Tax=Abyssobacteria bacterium (strain SURF_5) TaxID=2093360 RepID=A0A3A4NK11_ABYX5|nr:MAG: hypothetical protein C4520_19825 [Candidatus Abyssubacteria bacterium SURF_5]